jgi:hypothetical protein
MGASVREARPHHGFAPDLVCAVFTGCSPYSHFGAFDLDGVDSSSPPKATSTSLGHREAEFDCIRVSFIKLRPVLVVDPRSSSYDS